MTTLPYIITTQDGDTVAAFATEQDRDDALLTGNHDDHVPAFVSDPFFTEPRTYVVSLPVVLTVHDDGTVTADVDLSEAADLDVSSMSDYLDADADEQGRIEDQATEDEHFITAAFDARTITVASTQMTLPKEG
jgi:hypothetical protein